jgi:hypothetical protein
MEDSSVSVDNIRLLTFPDGSYLERYRHRFNGLAPWIDGNIALFCGSCQERWDTFTDLAEAQLYYLSHALSHAQAELEYLWRKIANGNLHGAH